MLNCLFKKYCLFYPSSKELFSYLEIFKRSENRRNNFDSTPEKVMNEPSFIDKEGDGIFSRRFVNDCCFINIFSVISEMQINKINEISDSKPSLDLTTKKHILKLIIIILHEMCHKKVFNYAADNEITHRNSPIILFDNYFHIDDSGFLIEYLISVIFYIFLFNMNPLILKQRFGLNVLFIIIYFLIYIIKEKGVKIRFLKLLIFSIIPISKL